MNILRGRYLPSKSSRSSLDDASKILNTGSNPGTNPAGDSKDKLNNGSFNKLDSGTGNKLGRESEGNSKKSRNMLDGFSIFFNNKI